MKRDLTPWGLSYRLQRRADLERDFARHLWAASSRHRFVGEADRAGITDALAWEAMWDARDLLAAADDLLSSPAG